jgi:hypothetical protein
MKRSRVCGSATSVAAAVRPAHHAGLPHEGGDRFTADQEREKRLVGELWARRSGDKGLYLMARKIDDTGLNVRGQLLAAIAGR